MVSFTGTFVAVILFAMLPAREIIDLFELKQHPYRYTEHNVGQILYRLFRPRHIEQDRTYPLIVWLHGYGAGEFEEIDYGHLRHVQHVFTSIDEAEAFEFYLLAVQCPPDQRGFYVSPTDVPESPNAGTARTPGEATVEIIRKLLNEYPIEQNKISVVGISGGGSDCFEMAMRHPEMFAGIAPLGSSGGDNSRIPSIAEIPVWAFHSESDSKTSAEGILRTASALQDAGGTADVTLVPGSNHDCWRLAFENYELLNWLLAQDRRPISWTPWLLMAGALTVLAGASYRELKRRRGTRQL